MFGGVYIVKTFWWSLCSEQSWSNVSKIIFVSLLMSP